MADIGKEMTLRGFAYTPKENGEGGVIVTCRLEVSVDGNTWSLVKDDIMFDNIVNNPITQQVVFEKPVQARYLRVTPIRVETGVGAVGVPSDTYGVSDISLLQ
jgi:hypothetical protein